MRRKVQAQLKPLCCMLALLAFECLDLPRANPIDRDISKCSKILGSIVRSNVTGDSILHQLCLSD